MNLSLTNLFIYPVKSLRGVALQEAAIVGGRLAGDREWLLVDQHDRFMHQRDYPQMARLRPVPARGGLVIEAAGRRPLQVTQPDPTVPVQFLRLWRRLAPVRPVSETADAWFTEALGVSARLMAFAAGVPAEEAPSWEVAAALQDATPFHVTCRESLEDLNTRIGSPIPMTRFRPNLVLSGAEPYAEDSWLDVRIGAATFRWVKPCTRCKMTTTDQETGERLSSEPLRTLATYRRLGSEVVFGHYFTALEDGVLRIGDGARVLALHE